MTQPRYKSILLQVIKSICTDKRHFKLKSYKENTHDITVEVRLNKAMYIEGNLSKNYDEFKIDLKRLVKAISDWAKNAKL